MSSHASIATVTVVVSMLLAVPAASVNLVVVVLLLVVVTVVVVVVVLMVVVVASVVAAQILLPPQHHHLHLHLRLHHHHHNDDDYYCLLLATTATTATTATATASIHRSSRPCLEPSPDELADVHGSSGFARHGAFRRVGAILGRRGTAFKIQSQCNDSDTAFVIASRSDKTDKVAYEQNEEATHGILEWKASKHKDEVQESIDANMLQQISIRLESQRVQVKT